ncbi:MAG: hypothetical protein HZB11_01465 [Candidatus Yonathbacteria bacterium]|nr:hypothetical protein [Candidatus Yonathbacteria bacterium]
MAFSFFTNRGNDETLILLVDIGSASVGGALVKIEKGRAPNVLATVRKDISFQEALSSARFLSAMNHALDQVLKTIHPKTTVLGSPAHIFCTLSSPWFILKTRRLLISRQEEFEVTERALDEFISEDIARLKEELKETLPPKDVKIIEKKIIQMKLNGYEIKNPYGQKTSQMEILMTIGVSSEKVIESIERKLGNVFHAKSVHFGAFPIAAFSAVRDISPTEKNFLFLDITGEATDVSLVNNDLLMGTVTFPHGKNFFIREISAEMRTVHFEAATLFAMFLRDELDDTKRARIAAIIARAEDEWLARLEKSLGALAKNGVLPQKVFFTTDAFIAPLFSLLLSRRDHIAKMEHGTNASFEAQYLDQLIVEKFVSFNTGVIRDPFMVIEALLAFKIVTQHK